MCAVVSEPSAYLPSMVKPTSASPLSSLTDDTEPTLMPDTVTSLPTAMPPASENSAWYRSAVAHCTQPLGLQPDGDDENDQDDTDEARPDEVSSAIFQHLALPRTFRFPA